MPVLNLQMLLNGRYHNSTSAVLNIQNRAFVYGDIISETLHACAGRLCFFDAHIKNLVQAMQIAQMNVPQKFLSESEEFKNEISKMLVKNKIFKGANVRISVFRSFSEGFEPDNDNTEYSVSIQPLNQTGFEFNRQGLAVAVYDKHRKYPTPLCGFDTHENCFLKMAALKFPYKDKVNDVLLLNAEGNLVESVLNGNVFIVKNKAIYTPMLEDGCAKDIMRERVLEVARNAGYGVFSDKHLSLEHLKQADEIFFSSTQNGVNWVGAFETRRFYKTVSQDIATKINDLYLNYQE